MQLNIYSLVGQCTLLCCLYALTSAKALVGQNVRQAEEREFPFVVSLMMTHQSDSELMRHFCTGTLISRRDVLTCQHCTTNKDEERIRVLVGSSDWRNAMVFEILWWLGYHSWARIFHESTSFTINDVAILRLSRDVPDTVQPATLATLSNIDSITADVWLAGWGKKDDGTNPIIMDVVRTQAISVEDCQRRLRLLRGRTVILEDNFFCSIANPYALLHQGDSGGPVIYQNRVIGISKGTCPFPDEYVRPDKLNVHFNMTFYLPYIWSVMELD